MATHHDQHRTDDTAVENIAALEAMANGEAVGDAANDPDEAIVAPTRRRRSSPLARTQATRIMGRTIRNGLE